MAYRLHHSPRMSRLSLAQGLYFLATGLAVIGAVLVVAGLRRHAPPELPLLAAGSAAGLAGIDTVYVAKRRIAPIYLLDAVAEAVRVACWVYLAATSAEAGPGAPRRPRRRITKRGG